MIPHSPFGLLRLPFNMFVSFGISSDRVSFSDEPFPDIFAVAGDDPNRTSEPVVVFDRDVNPLAANLLDQSTLHTFSVPEPIAVPVFRDLIELGCVKTGESYFLSGYANPVTVSDIGFTSECVRAVLSAWAASPARGVPE